ncbi:MAG: OpgC domain-containing protein [Methylococcaceae bacterium]|nr:OpgC domain-containing protein [Methylococcaceae bacterium]
MKTAPIVTPSDPLSSKFAYLHNHHIGRDLRLDFLRGLIMLVVISVHIEYFSLFSMFAWERIGYVSSAEGFVALSGIVLGIVYKRRLHREGFKSCAIKLWQRSFQLYRINLFIILSIPVLGTIPGINIYEVSHWQNWSLYPPVTASWQEILQQALLLRIGPHQFQVIGLYVVLMALAPLVLFCLQRQKTLLLIVMSCLLYGLNHKLHLRITGAGFERGFPSLTWQLLFVNGMAVGYHHEKVLGYLIDRKNKILILIAGLICLAFLILNLNKPSVIFWPWQTLSLIDPVYLQEIYRIWFQKNNLGLGRIINNIALFIVLYYALSHYWLPINKALGWLLIPLGQASLYVFILHVYFIILVSNTPLPGYHNFFINTGIHLATILIIWAMVKYRVLFKLIPS